jgi:hypothetical protein
LAEPLQFGLQDTKGEVHPGIRHSGTSVRFDIVLDVIGDGAGDRPPVFRSAFAHGATADRFVYLSWKREGIHQHPWAWRIKIPVSGIRWAEVREAEDGARCLEANVVGRRPHTSEAVQWQPVPL